MGYKFLELPNFDKKEHELERVFQKLFKIAEMNKMTKEERELYHSDVKAKSDWNAGISFAEKKAKAEGLEEGLKEGLEKGRIEKAISMAKVLKKKAMLVKDIAEITGLSVQKIEAL